MVGSEQLLARAQRAALESCGIAELVGKPLQLLARAFDASTVSAYRVTERGIEGTMSRGPSDLFESYMTAVDHQPEVNDPLISLKGRLNLRIGVTTQLVDQRVYRRSLAYNNLYAPLDIVDQLVLRVSPIGYSDGVGAVAVLLTRGRHQPRWHTHEVNAIARLVPALEGAVRREVTMSAQARKLMALGSVVEHLDSAAAAILSLAGECVWVSQRGERLLAPWLGRSRQLPAPLLSRLHALRELWSSDSPSAAVSTHVHLAATPHSLACELVVMRAKEGEHPYVLLRAQEPPDASSTFGQNVQHFGLTAREATVVSLLTDGLSNSAIAQTLFISPETVRKHLQTVFRKMGARSRLEVVAKLR